MQVANVKYFNSGGNVYIYYGKFEDGKYFALGSNTLNIYNTDFAEVLSDEFYEKYDGDTSEWDSKHMIDTYSFPTTDMEIINTGKNIFEKLKETYPNMDMWDEWCQQELLL